MRAGDEKCRAVHGSLGGALGMRNPRNFRKFGLQVRSLRADPPGKRVGPPCPEFCMTLAKHPVGRATLQLRVQLQIIEDLIAEDRPLAVWSFVAAMKNDPESIEGVDR